MNIMIVGVGGQGTLLASRILGKVAIKEGYDVKVSEVHGMSQRGGSVVTYVKYGDKVYSPIIDRGEADLILAFEKDNIDSRHIWRPLHTQPIFADCDYIDNGGVSQKIFDRGICLPSDTNFDNNDLERIGNVIKKLWKEN